MQWKLETGHGENILNPDWQQIQHALLEMDGNMNDTVTVVDKGSLVIGGGNEGRYMVVYFPEIHPDLPSLTLTDPSLTGPDVTLTIQTPAEFTAKYAVKAPLVLQVVESFFRTGQVPGDMHWESDNTKEEVLNAGRGEREGQVFGDYRLTHLIGRSSFAEVYLGQHLNFARRVAIKVLYTALTDEELMSFQQEVQMLFPLDHPHILPLIDFGVQAFVPFVVRDFAPLGSLRLRHFLQKVVPLSTVVSYVKQVASALQYTHERGQIHGKVKPENMLVGKKYKVRLSDFQIPVIASHTPLLRIPELVPYLAPEQIQGSPQPASDQYALGIVVYEWLCGIRPFQGDLSEIIQQHLSTSPVPLREHVSTIPLAIEEVVLRALAKEPDQRFPHVEDFAVALEQAYQK